MAKLDKMKFARVVAHCVSNGMSAGEYEVNTLDELIDIEVPVQDNPRVSQEAVNELLALMAEGTRKIEAIRAYRVLTNAGLKEAKDAVEKYSTFEMKFNKQQFKDKMNEYCKSQNVFADIGDNINNFINWCF